VATLALSSPHRQGPVSRAGISHRTRVRLGWVSLVQARAVTTRCRRSTCLLRCISSTCTTCINSRPLSLRRTWGHSTPEWTPTSRRRTKSHVFLLMPAASLEVPAANWGRYACFISTVRPPFVYSDCSLSPL